jgi:hypothetical protein
MRFAAALLSVTIGLLLIVLTLSYLLLYALPARTLIIAGLVIGAGMVIAPVLWVRGAGRFARALAAGVGMLAVTAVLLEGMLWVLRRPIIRESMIDALTYFPFECDPVCANPPEVIAGHRFDPASPDPMIRTQLKNDLGFQTHVEFDPAAIPEGVFRVLASGDSFTVGFTAQMGRSYVEQAQANVPGALIWNAAFSGTNVVQHLNVLEHIAPIMQPDLLLIGLNENDMTDFAPRGSQFVHVSPEGGSEVRWVSRYSYTPDFQPVLLDELAVRYRYYNIEGVPLDAATRAALATRTGYLLYFAFRRLSPVRELWSYPGVIEHGVRFNTEHLTRLKAEADARGIPVLGMMIRTHESVHDRQRAMSRAWYSAVAQAGIPYLDPSDALVPADFINANPSDNHWNDDGHAKAGALLTECLAYMAANEGALCPQAIVPGV